MKKKYNVRIYNKQIGQRLSEFTHVNNPTMDDRLSNKVLKSSGWMKQENKTKIHIFEADEFKILFNMH